MNWLLLAQLVAKEGFPFAIAMWKMMAAGGAPTEEQLAVLDKLSRNTASSKLTDALIANGIDLNSPQAIALLALTNP